MPASPSTCTSPPRAGLGARRVGPDPPVDGGRLRADFTAIRDDYRDRVERDSLWAVSAWQEIAQLVTLSGSYSMLDSDSRDYQVRADLYSADWDLRVDASWYHLLKRQEMESLDLDQLVSVVGEYLPYMQGRLALAKGLGDHVVIQAGARSAKAARSTVTRSSTAPSAGSSLPPVSTTGRSQV